MGKKLVKTAKQQFEERLRELGNHVGVGANGETFHSGGDKQGNFYILRTGNADVEYSEFDYGCKLIELYENEEFLNKLATEFALSCGGIKPILEWWSNADKDAEPFGLSDIVKFAPVKRFVEFQDIYEEVPDVRIVTAKEQWINDAAGALKLSENLCVKVTANEVKFFRNDDVYSCTTYPSLEKMRGDAKFVCHVADSMNEANMTNEVALFLKWVRTGGEFPIPLSVIFHSDYQSYSYEEYEDKEEQPIAKQDFKEEMEALRAKMIAHIEQLCEQGMKLNAEVLCMNYTLTWTDRSYVICEDIEDCWFAKDDSGKWMFYRKTRDGEWDSKIEYFTIETLKDFIEALQ